MIKSVTQLRTVDFPFAVESIFTARLNLPATDYEDAEARPRKNDAFQLFDRFEGSVRLLADSLADPQASELAGIWERVVAASEGAALGTGTGDLW